MYKIHKPYYRQCGIQLLLILTLEIIQNMKITKTRIDQEN